MNKFKVTLKVDDNEWTAIFNEEKEADKFIHDWKRSNDPKLISITKEVI